MSLFDDIRRLFEAKDVNGDVTFLVHGEEVRAHKLILSARSVAFETMFANPPDAQGRYPFTDPQVTAQNFKDFIKFLYTDEIVINYDNKAAFLRLGDMYFVPLLEQKCINAAHVVTQEFIAVTPENQILPRLMNLLEETVQADKIALICIDSQEVYDVIVPQMRHLAYAGDMTFFVSYPLGHSLLYSAISDFHEIKDIDVIINVDLPTDLDAYKTRIGHHGRLDEIQRRAITFVNDYEPILDEIADMMREHGIEVPEVLENFIGGH